MDMNLKEDLKALYKEHKKRKPKQNLKHYITSTQDALFSLYQKKYSFDELLKRLRQVELGICFEISNLQSAVFGVVTGFCVSIVVTVITEFSNRNLYNAYFVFIISLLFIFCGLYCLFGKFLIQRTYSYKLMIYFPYERQLIINKLQSDYDFIYQHPNTVPEKMKGKK